MKKQSRDILWLHPTDNVVVALRPLRKGEVIDVGADHICVNENIMTGHKLAIRPIAITTMVRKYGEDIGAATADIKPGDHVHVHNVRDITAEIHNARRGDIRS